MATGRILQFDHARGYGFVAVDDGGEDVFLHASAFDGDSSELMPGTGVEFRIMAGDRGRKAYSVRLGRSESATPGQFIPQQVSAPAPANVTDEEQMCDVLSQAEFTAEITDLLLNTIPGLTGPQILEVRRGILEFATRQGWVDA